MVWLNATDRELAEQVVHETVADCLRVVQERRSAYSLPKGIVPEIRLSWSEKRRYSRGGLSSRKRPFISLGMAAIQESNAHPAIGARFAEYKRINRSSSIGGFISKDWLDYYRCLAIHETAHAIQGYLYMADNGLRQLMAKPHGIGWQGIYALLRSGLLNRRILERDGLFPLNWDMSLHAAREKAGAPLMILADTRDVLHLCPTGGDRVRSAGWPLCGGSFASLKQASISDNLPVSRVACPRCLCALMGN